MNIQQLEYFISISETLSYSKSAELLGLSQPALSMSITKLEEELGFALFVKSGRNIKISQSGSLFYKSTQDAIKTLKDGAFAAKSLVDDKSDYLNLAITNNMMQPYIAELLNEFIEKYPDIKMSIFQKDMAEIIYTMKTSNFDWAICPLHKYLFEKNNVSYEILTEQAVSIVLKSSNPLANKKRIEFKELLDQTCLLNNEFWQGRIIQILGAEGIDAGEMDFRIVPAIDTILNKMLENDNTVYITNSPSQKMEQKENLQIIPLSDISQIKECYVLAWYGRKKEAGVHKLFYDFVTQIKA